MAQSENNPNLLLATYSILTGLTPLIPVPLVDDLFYSYFLRSMVRKLATAHNQELSPEAVRALTTQPGGGCPLGCVATLLIYPFKKALRKILYFLEWKRATDVISRTYYEGYLIDTALERGWLQTYGPAKVRAAMDRLLARTNTSPVKGAVFGVVKHSKAAMLTLVQALMRFLPGNKRRLNETEVAEAVAAVEEEAPLGGLINQLQSAIGKIPAQHLENLQAEFAKELELGASTKA